MYCVYYGYISPTDYACKVCFVSKKEALSVYASLLSSSFDGSILFCKEDDIL